MTLLIQSMVVATVVAGVLSGELSRAKRQADFQCPQANGLYQNPSDCSSYYSCSEGVAIEQFCDPQLVFNPANEQCDWSTQVQVSGCAPTTRGAFSGPNSALCASGANGAKDGEAFTVAHPNFCNAFYMCGPGFLHTPCIFCPEDMYYTETADGTSECVSHQGVDPTTVCGGVPYVEHYQKVMEELKGSCSADNQPNPMQPLVDKLEREGYPQPPPPSGNNNYNNNNNRNFRPNSNFFRG